MNWRGGTRRTAVLLSAWEQGRRDARKGKGKVRVHNVAEPPYKDPERAEAWERGWRFQRELIERNQKGDEG